MQPSPPPPHRRTNSTGSTSASALQRPSLIAGLKSSRSGGNPTISHTMLPWKIVDTNLRPVPALYPPLNPQCTTYIGDASPSVVAARISECLRRRSISVEYDEEAHTATCLTIDRVHFTIQLYRGPDNKDSMEAAAPDFSHGVLVECVRVRGCNMSFHHACRAILSAALGHTDGQDLRSPLRTSVLEYPRLDEEEGRPSKRARVQVELTTPTTASGSTASFPQQALEDCLGLLKKDRIDAQQLGMQSLVTLTDARTCGVEAALHVSLTVLGAPVVEGLEELKTWVFSLLKDRVTPSEDPEEANVSNIKDVSFTDTFLGDSDINASQETSVSAAVAVEDAHHGGNLRAMAFRALCNSLVLISQHQPSLLRTILTAQAADWVSEPLLNVLVEDLAGASRPPVVVVGTRLASAHEATLAATCLGILAEHSERALELLNPDQHDEASIASAVQEMPAALQALEKARAAGRASHQRLGMEAEKAVSILTQDLRSC